VSRRPVIGICAAIDRARWAVWDVEANISQRTYSRAVVAAGGLPVILPAHHELAGDPGALIEMLDGLIMPGGTDLDPRLYGAEPDERTSGVSAERDAFELALMRRALEVEIPLLAICRGMQLLNVALGGTLEQHIPGAERHLHTPGVFSDHEVRLEPGSLVAAAAGAEQLQVSSHHHQGIGRLGEGLKVTGRSVPDGVAEAIELAAGDHAIGILWHTEEEQDSPLVADLVAAAREHCERESARDTGVAS
jgi:putative glutamine amidotransferase